MSQGKDEPGELTRLKTHEGYNFIDINLTI